MVRRPQAEKYRVIELYGLNIEKNTSLDRARHVPAPKKSWLRHCIHPYKHT